MKKIILSALLLLTSSMRHPSHHIYLRNTLIINMRYLMAQKSDEVRTIHLPFFVTPSRRIRFFCFKSANAFSSFAPFDDSGKIAIFAKSYNLKLVS